MVHVYTRVKTLKFAVNKKTRKTFVLDSETRANSARSVPPVIALV